MIVGYIDAKENIYCTGCWTTRVAANERRPVRILRTATGKERDVFRIIDECEECGAKLDYEEAESLS